MRSKKFSIVTPSLNQGIYIEATIRSVISQEGDFEIEYLVMDGGSTDESVSIIQRYAELINEGKLPVACRGVRMIWRSGPDSGQSDAINLGLDRATGDYCAYLNSDDVYLPGAFAAVARAFDEMPDADFVYGDGEVVDENGKLQWAWLSRPYNQRVMTTYWFLWNDFTNYILQQATFWKRSVGERIGFFDPAFHYAMDHEYWVRASASGLQLRHLAVKLAQFRMIAGTKSLSSPTVFWGDFLEIVRRHRGARKMAVYFAYYCMNCARQRDWNWEAARPEAAKQLRRWSALATGEKDVISRQFAYGEGYGCFLIANELQKIGRFGEARAYLARGFRQSPRGAFRPLGIFPILKDLSGQKPASIMDTLVAKIVQRYRESFVDYRYRDLR